MSLWRWFIPVMFLVEALRSLLSLFNSSPLRMHRESLIQFKTSISQGAVMPTSTTDVTEVFYNELRNGRIRVSSILHHWQPHHDMTWRKTIPWLWRHYGDDIRKEINRDRKST